jgi:hypothetical protein
MVASQSLHRQRFVELRLNDEVGQGKAVDAFTHVMSSAANI